MKGQCKLALLLYRIFGSVAVWDPSMPVVGRGQANAAARSGRIVSEGRGGQDDLVVEVRRAVSPKRLIGSLNRDTGVSQWGEIPMLLTGVIPVGLRKAADVVEQF